MITLPPPLQCAAQAHHDSIIAALAAVEPAAAHVLATSQAWAPAWVFSEFALSEALNAPGRLADLLLSSDLQRAYAPGDLAQRLASAWQHDMERDLATAVPARVPLENFDRFIRSFRRREMLRIALRDLCAKATLNETLTDLSCLADTCLQLALDFHYQQQVLSWGHPQDPGGGAQSPVIIGLGKLGAHELNFSSDVDLMFAYAAEGTTSGGARGSATNEEFHIRVIRGLIRSIDARTADGFVFRVDARLRPFGESGPLLMSFDQLENYYQEHGREWERYALIKARVAAGDLAAGHELLTRLKPFIYRRYLDYGVFEGLRDMKALIAGEMRNHNLSDDIKLGPGGIREIEFFGQMFQLIRGGVEPSLQLRPIQAALGMLAQNGYIPAATAQVLTAAYIFLRRVENRLQAFADRQTHRLPDSAERQLCLAVSMGFADWSAFAAGLQTHRRMVHQHFTELLTDKAAAPSAGPLTAAERWLENPADTSLDNDDARRAISGLGYQDPSRVIQLIRSLHEDRRLQALSATGRRRLQRLLPLVLRAAGRAEAPEVALDRICDLIRSISQRAAYLALLLEKPVALDHLVRLTGASPWIATFLNQHPVLLDELLDPRTLYRPPQRTALVNELQQRLAEIDPDDLEYQMELLRVFKQVNVLRVAASDITHVLPLMKVSDHLSDIAETIIATVVTLCWQNLTRKYGRPIIAATPGGNDRGFAVIAYGKLGGLELGYGSDLDLVFLHAAQPGNTSAAERAIESATFFSRLGQRVLHMLTTHTAAGRLYEVDMRLRPSGDSGMLVSHIEAFQAYQQESAWNWEHQALIRARAVSGDLWLRRRFESIRHAILTRRRETDALRGMVADMRVRLRKEHPVTDDAFDIKHGPGGIVDIEFLVQYLVLRYACRQPAIVRWTDNVRLLQALNEAGVLDDTTAFGLRRAYLIMRAMVHRLDLRRQPALVTDERFTPARRFVVQAWNRFLAPPRLDPP